jgi:hypothetical protein
MVVTKVNAVKTTTAGTTVPMHSIAGDGSTTVTVPLLCVGSGLTFGFGSAMRAFSYADRAAADAAPLIDGASGRIGVRMGFALTAWRRFLP